jgi:aminopeptidase N
MGVRPQQMPQPPGQLLPVPVPVLVLMLVPVSVPVSVILVPESRPGLRAAHDRQHARKTPLQHLDNNHPGATTNYPQLPRCRGAAAGQLSTPVARPVQDGAGQRSGLTSGLPFPPPSDERRQGGRRANRLATVPDAPPAQERERKTVLDVVSYQLALDLTGGPATFSSRAEVRFRCRRPGADVLADLDAVSVRRAELNGRRLSWPGPGGSGHLLLPRLAEENVLTVDAELAYVRSGGGLQRAGGPAGRDCVYGKGYPGGAPRIFCCFDQEDLRAPVTVSVSAPAGWSCLANGPVLARPAAGAAGRWDFAPTPPIAPYLSSICAGPFCGCAFTCRRGDGASLPVTFSALPAAAARMESMVSPELIQQPLRYYERVLGTAYPYAKCDLVFVPAYIPLAFGAPGLVTIQQRVLDLAAGDESGLYLAAVVAHELAHAWFGGLTDIPDRHGGWLFEALPTYLSRIALEESRPGLDLWQEPASGMLPDHDYAGFAARIRQLAERIGSQAVLDGLRILLREQAGRCVTSDDLIRCWSRASGQELPAAARALIATAPEPPGR